MGWSLCFWHMSVRMTHDVVAIIDILTALKDGDFGNAANY